MIQSFSILFLLAGLLSYLNYKWIKLPNTIALMLFGVAFTFLLILSEDIAPAFYKFFCDLVVDADFKTILLDVMLSFLLFSGAMNININALAKEKKSVFLFATLGVLISTALVGVLIFGAAQLLEIPLSLINAFLFGALISPTDPIAVIAILKKAGVSESLEMKIEGESLFNDGIGVVVFSGILLLLKSGTEGNDAIGGEIGMLFLEEVVGGILFGGVLGFAGYYLMRSVKENAQLVVILSLGIAMGGYAIVSMLHMSGPLAMVVAGLIIGNKFNLAANKGKAQKSLQEIWEVLDESFNGILFLLIGVVAHLLVFNGKYLTLGIIAFVVVLLSRFISVILPFSLLKHEAHTTLKTVSLLTWGGLRGGISLALALSISTTEDGAGELLFFITYTVVLMSIVLQGLSIGKLVALLYPKKIKET
ncbi:MAG: CPA1 family monovalent cation:H+ antiporter [Vicingaceae bacterium]|jgi:CPA1 family monovalent cation:H+ antiporter